MSKSIAQKTVLVPTEMGNFAATYEIIENYDVEDVVRAKALAQALKLQMKNIGRQLVYNATYPADTIPSAFKDSED